MFLVPLAVVVTLAFGVGGWNSEALKLKRPRPGAAYATTLMPSPSQVTLVPAHVPPAPVSVAQAATNAALELAGSGDSSVVRWFPDRGLWGKYDAPPVSSSGWFSPYWWQSALDLRALVRYLEQTRDPNPIYEQIIERTFSRNVRRPNSNMPVNFGNQFMDDTAWWGLAWLEASRYELIVRADQARSAEFLRVAKWIANYIWRQPRTCQQAGIVWERGFPPDTITNAEFVAFAGELAFFLEQPGPFQDTATARLWMRRGWQILWWLRHVNLANPRTGHVYDGYGPRCKIVGGSLVYTQGEMADALVQMGLATGQSSYFVEAQRFINYAFKPKSRMILHGVLQQPCEAEAHRCLNITRVDDLTVYKGLFVDAVADWQAATGSHIYDAFLRQQGRAVISNAASNGRRLAHCQTPHACQFTFYWSRPIPPDQSRLPVEPGSQESGLSALTDDLTTTAGFTG